MKDLTYITGEIEKGRNPEVNLPKYANSMMSLYNGLAYIKLSMNYYTFYDMANDTEFGKADVQRLRQLTEQLNSIMASVLLTHDKAADEGTAQLDAIRNEVISIMDVVTVYVDRLRIYEYILNRIEYRFIDEEWDEDYYNSGLTNDLMHYILSDRDSVAVNNRISEVIEQLPMRLSKNKFFEYLRESFSIYKGAQIQTVDDFDYSLRTSGMLYEPDGFGDMFGEVHELYEDIAGADYKNITREQFEVISDKLIIATGKMSDTADMYVMFMQLVNDLYTVLLSEQYKLGDVDETIKACGVIRTVWNNFMYRQENASYDDGVTDTAEDDVMDAFISFEGKQERIGETVAANDYAISFALEHMADALADNDMTEEYEKLLKIVKLQSGSDFVALVDKEGKGAYAADEYVENVCEKLIADFANSFENMDRMVCRAVMSAVLSQVPVFFNNIDEIQSYINTSLMSCSDNAERQACVEVLGIIMQG